MKRIFALGVILLFFVVAITPSINTSVVKASTDDDLVEVTTQACGIPGNGNTTVKLTRVQYQNLEEYFVEFRTKLNQKSTREEAVPIFKDAVVELDKYGLLGGLSVERAQKLVTVMGSHQKTRDFFESLMRGTQDNGGSNIFCLVAGKATHSGSFGTFYPLRHLFLALLDIFLYAIGFVTIGIFLSFLLESLPELRSNFFPFFLCNEFGIGYSSIEWGGEWNHHPSTASIFSLGLLGLNIYSGSYYGQIRCLEYLFEPTATSKYYSGIIGFTGLNIKTLLGGTNFFLGSCLLIDLDPALPEQ